jgi:UDPglucose 6-dehydrogenase
MNKIGIIGQGFVGNAVAQKFQQYYEILTYDLDETKANATEEEVLSCNIVFLCLPTPMKETGECDISIVAGVLEKIINLNQPKVVVIKSTVPPLTVEAFNKITSKNIQIVFNPEFLTERNAVEDYNNQKRIILGGPRPATTTLKRIFSKVFPKADIIKTDSTHAEMVKYLTNTFLSTKVSFANEIYQLCEKVGIDYDKVVEYAIYDERLGKSHWMVPGHDGDFGYGGHCFPKDLAALIHLANRFKTTTNVLEAVQQTNDNVRNNRDWEQMKGRAVS